MKDANERFIGLCIAYRMLFNKCRIIDNICICSCCEWKILVDAGGETYKGCHEIGYRKIGSMFGLSITFDGVLKIKYVKKVYTTRGETRQEVVNIDLDLQETEKMIRQLKTKCVEGSTCVSSK